jgi:hypothetical protein
MNHGEEAVPFALVVDGRQSAAEQLPPRSIATFVHGGSNPARTCPSSYP